jgi:hypothetical protein
MLNFVSRSHLSLQYKKRKKLSVLSYRSFLVLSLALTCLLVEHQYLSSLSFSNKNIPLFYRPFCGHSLVDLAFSLELFLSIVRTLHTVLSFNEIISSRIDRRIKYRNGCDRKQGLFFKIFHMRFSYLNMIKRC